jgi:hypothetical protein
MDKLISIATDEELKAELEARSLKAAAEKELTDALDHIKAAIAGLNVPEGYTVELKKIVPDVMSTSGVITPAVVIPIVPRDPRSAPAPIVSVSGAPVEVTAVAADTTVSAPSDENHETLVQRMENAFMGVFRDPRNTADTPTAE